MKLKIGQRIAHMERREIIRLFRELCNQPLHEFPAPGGEPCASNKQGVYIIREPNNRVLYVGRTKGGRNGILQRLQDHLNGRSSFTNDYLGGYGWQLVGCFFQYLEVDDERKRALLELFATGWLCPVHLGVW